MALYEHWPYVNFHELNLDWIVREMKDMTDRIENYVAELGIKYADPFDWSITSQYEQNTLVIEPESGTAYLSLQAVPAGINILNTDYWTPVFTLGDLITGIREGTAFAVEETNICTAPRAAGDLVWVDKTLVRCLQTILAGSEYNYGTGGNCEQISVEIILNSLQSAVDTNTEDIGDLGSDMTILQTTVTNQGNSIDALDGRMTTAEGNISDNADAIANIQGQIGSLIQARKYVLIGDSYGQGYTPDGSVNGWCVLFRDKLGLNADNCIILTTGGSSFAHAGAEWSDVVLAQEADAAVTDVIVCGGYNDNPYTENQVSLGMYNFKQACDVKYPNADVYVGFIGGNTNDTNVGYNLFRCAVWYSKYAGWNNMKHLEGTKNALFDAYTFFSSDGIHPNQDGQNSIARAIINAYLHGDAGVMANYENLTCTPSNDWNAINDTSLIGVTFSDGVYHLTQRDKLIISGDSHTLNCNGKTWIEMATISGGYIHGDYYGRTNALANMIIKSGSTYYHINGTIKIQDKKLWIACSRVTSDGTNYDSFSGLNEVQIMPFTADFPAIYN